MVTDRERRERREQQAAKFEQLTGYRPTRADYKPGSAGYKAVGKVFVIYLILGVIVGFIAVILGV